MSLAHNDVSIRNTPARITALTCTALLPIQKVELPNVIALTRLNGHTFAVNCDLIRIAEESPDTTLTLVTGEKLVVKETCAEVMTRMRIHRANILRSAWPDAATALGAVQAFHNSQKAEA